MEISLVAVAAIVGHNRVALGRGFHSLLHQATNGTAAVILARRAGAFHGLLTILAPVVTVFILIDLTAAFHHQTLLLGLRGNAVGTLKCTDLQSKFSQQRKEKRKKAGVAKNEPKVIQKCGEKKKAEIAQKKPPTFFEIF